MSRRGLGDGELGGGFPRVSGDEPTLAVNEQATEGFSPRERG